MQSPFEPRHFGPDLSDGSLGVVVLHGFTGAPSDVWPVARALALAGFATRVPLLRGHDGGVDGIREATLEDWREDVLESVRQVYSHTKRPVYVAGLSLGSLLAIDLALSEEIPLAGVALLSTPLSLGGLGRSLSEIANRNSWLRGLTMPKFSGSDIENGAPLPGARGMPMLAVHQLFRLRDRVSEGLARLNVPALILHAQHDHTAPIIDGYRLAATMPASPMRFVVMQRGFHVITRDVDCGRVASEVVAFARRLEAA